MGSAPVDPVVGCFDRHTVKAISGVPVWKDKIFCTGGYCDSQAMTFAKGVGQFGSTDFNRVDLSRFHKVRVFKLVRLPYAEDTVCQFHGTSLPIHIRDAHDQIRILTVGREIKLCCHIPGNGQV